MVYFCLKCKKEDKHEHKLSKLKGLTEGTKDKEDMNEEEKNKYLESILDEYYNLDYEDLIGGGSVKTRFKYRKVPAADFGLTEEEILLLDDNQLNRLVSLKKLRPYAEQEEEVNMHRVRNLKRQWEGEIKEKKKMIKQQLVQSLEQDKDKNLKQPGGKSDFS